MWRSAERGRLAEKGIAKSVGLEPDKENMQTKGRNMGGRCILESACRLFVREATNWSQGYYRKDMLFAIVKKSAVSRKRQRGTP